MADPNTKSAKVLPATPKIGPSGGISNEAALSAALGSKVRIQLAHPSTKTVEGVIFTISSQYQTVAVVSPVTTSASQSFTLVPFSSIQSFTITSPATASVNQNTLAVLDQNALQARLKSTIAGLKAEDARRGRGVTEEAQAVFDAFAKTLPARWDGENIIVSDSVVIYPPYTPDSCKAGSGAAAQSLPRIKKVLENERKKIVEKINANKPAATSSAETPRKGG